MRGKDLYSPPFSDACQDHPRLCGEKAVTDNSFDPGVGSPPPMRGKDTAEDFFLFNDGITPAYAGKSCHF